MVTSETRTVATESGSITYLLTVKKVKNWNLRIKPDGSVLLSVNRRTTKAQADEFIRGRSAWIMGHLENMERQVSKPRPAEYREGEPYTLQGRAAHLPPLPGETAEARKKAFRKRMDSLARAEFQAALDRVYPLVAGAGVKPPELKIRRMVSRWGSCHCAKGVIVLNTALLAVPQACLDYVALHELTHFLHPNHGPGFYAAMSQRMPDWKQKRKALQEYSGMMDVF